MPVFAPNPGMPGISGERLARHRTVAADGYLDFLPGGLIFDGPRTRDPDNPDFPTYGDGQRRLRPGLLVGKVAATGKYANSVIGVTQGAYVGGGTTVTVTPAQALEIVRRVGAAGNLTFVGPPAANGTVAVIVAAFSAVNTSTGVVTVTSLGANLIAGAYVMDTDGTQTPLTFLPDGWEVPVPADGGDFPFQHPPIRGNIDGSKLLPWPADASLRAWIRAALNLSGKFVFTEQF